MKKTALLSIMLLATLQVAAEELYYQELYWPENETSVEYYQGFSEYEDISEMNLLKVGTIAWTMAP